MIPIALGIFYFTGVEWLIELKPWYGALAMSFSSVFVILNALRLNLFDLNKKSNVRKTIDFDENILNDFIKKEGDNNMKKLVINVDGMMCMHCKKHVEDACMKVAGVSTAEANLDAKNVTVSFENEVSKDELIKSIKEAGYEAK